MSTTQVDALERLGGRLIPLGRTVMEPVRHFGRSAPLVLEIGSGMGRTTVMQAAADPATDILAVDVHTPGIATLLVQAEQAGVSNVRAVIGDAVEVVDHMLAASSLTGVRIYFPDPWPKVRHRKRRLIQKDFVDLLVPRVKPGGFLHCATDIEQYADQMLAVLSAHPQLHNPFEGFAPRPTARPMTKFEARGLAEDRPSIDIWVTRRVRP